MHVVRHVGACEPGEVLGLTSAVVVDGDLLLWLRERNLQEDLEITSLLHRKKITAQIVRTTPA